VRVALALALGCGALVAATLALAGRQSSDAAAKPLPGLPRYTAGYARWTKLNKRPIPPRAADAHLGRKNVYASRLPRRGERRFPAGTVVVKEIVRPNAKFVGVVAVMRKLRGFNREHHDWQMIEYTRSSTNGRFTVLARGQICYSCHMAARNRDYAFTYKRR
jgi:hypothetical protein